MPKQAEARQTRIRREAEHRRRVLRMATILSSKLGEDYFRSIVQHLASTLGADCAYVAETTGTPIDRIRSLAVFAGGHPSDGFEQSLSGTTSGQVLSDGVFACGKDARRIFPLDEWVQNLGAEAFMGVRLSDSRGEVVGVLAVASRHPFGSTQMVRSVLEALVPRTAAEVERKRSDEVRKRNEERHEAFIAMNADAMWRVEFDQPIPLNLTEEQQLDRIYRFGYVAECNAALAKLARAASIEELLGCRFPEVGERINPAVRDELRAAIRSGFRTTMIETTSRDNSGEQMYRLRSQFGIVEDGELRRIWGTTRDITVLRRTELSLAASERSFRAVLEGIQMPALMLNVEGKITFVNHYFIALTQRSLEDIMAGTWLSGIIPDVDAEIWKRTLLPDARGGHPTLHVEGSVVALDGQSHLIAWDTICLFNDLNQLTGLAAIGTDVTRQRALETKVRRAEKLESVGRLAAGIAHDFNNLLTIILGNASHMLHRTRESDVAHEQLASIEKAATQCSELTSQLLAFGRKQHMRLRLVNLNDVIEDDEPILRGLLGEEMNLVLNLAPSLSPVKADPNQIRRTLSNLTTNARDAMTRGGMLMISTADVEIDTENPMYSGIEAGCYVRLSVSDTGIGFNEEIRAHIFEPFFTTKPPGKGLGLGLATVYGVVTQSGGHIIVDSKPGEGTTFEILLPEAPTPSEDDEAYS